MQPDSLILGAILSLVGGLGLAVFKGLFGVLTLDVEELGAILYLFANLFRGLLGATGCDTLVDVREWSISLWAWSFLAVWKVASGMVA